MNSVFVVMLSLFFVLVVEVTFVDGEDPGTPLFLTPLIESGKIREARTKAFVRHHEMGDVRSYSGYLTVNKDYNSNLFFWFFPAFVTENLVPVVLWLQGGPGLTSSMFGLFSEHGPFRVTVDQTLEIRPNTWIYYHNVIYIDSPVGTGYSFTDNEKGYSRNSTQVALDLHTALVQFFLMFPEHRTNDFFVTGEGYAGKYVIELSNKIKNYNIKAETKINLKGLAIANGFCDPENQLLYSDYFDQIGLIDLHGKSEFREYEQTIREFMKQKNFVKAFEYYDKLFGDKSLFSNLTGFFNYPYYNYINADVNNDDNYHEIFLFNNWILRNNVRCAIHVGNTTFNLYNGIVLEYQKEDYLKSVVVYLKDLLEHYKVLIYNGQLNIVNSYPLAANYLQKMQWSGAEKFTIAPRKFWTFEGELAGYTKNADNLTFVLVRNAGYLIFVDQLKWALNLITRFTHNEEF